MKKYKVEFVFEVAEDVEDEEIIEWANKVIGRNGVMFNDSPLFFDSSNSATGTYKIDKVEQ